MRIFKDISQTIGGTPLVKLNRINADIPAKIYAKLEFFNPASCVKERIAEHIIKVAEKDGQLKPGGTIIEATSGNTGVGLAMMAAARNYKLIITMPETMSIERRMILEHFGADVILTPGDKGMTGAIKKAEELSKSIPGAFLARQFENPANPEIHRLTTAKEIWEDTDGKVDIFVSGVGTGGTITGVASFLKEKKKNVEIIAIEPEESAVLSGKLAGKHGIQGIGAGFVPEILNVDFLDEVITVNVQEAIETARKLAKLEGIFCGISSGAACFGALKVGSRTENRDKHIVVILPDTGERYLSTDLFKQIKK